MTGIVIGNASLAPHIGNRCQFAQRLQECRHVKNFLAKLLGAVRFIRAFQDKANLATKGAVEKTLPVTIHTPLINLTKAQIIQRGLELGVDYSLTTSCYDPPARDQACGKCDACLLRLRGFEENAARDPARYAGGREIEN